MPSTDRRRARGGGRVSARLSPLPFTSPTKKGGKGRVGLLPPPTLRERSRVRRPLSPLQLPRSASETRPFPSPGPFPGTVETKENIGKALRCLRRGEGAVRGVRPAPPGRALVGNPTGGAHRSRYAERRRGAVETQNTAPLSSPGRDCAVIKRTGTPLPCAVTTNAGPDCVIRQRKKKPKKQLLCFQCHPREEEEEEIGRMDSPSDDAALLSRARIDASYAAYG